MELEYQFLCIVFLIVRNKFNFVFINCFVILSNQILVFQFIFIFLWVILQEGFNLRVKNVINVNIVLLDFVFRVYFYCFLFKIVEMLRSLVDRLDVVFVRVYDFELF